MSICSFGSVRKWVTAQFDGIKRQAPAARMIGEFVVRQGAKTFENRMSGRRSTNSPASQSGSVESSVAASVAAESTDMPRVESLRHGEPFPGYDTYTARQILERVEQLSATEREQVRAFEAAHRARETVLSALASPHSVSTSA